MGTFLSQAQYSSSSGSLDWLGILAGASLVVAFVAAAGSHNWSTLGTTAACSMAACRAAFLAECPAGWRGPLVGIVG